jgi:hypothetical protein
MFIKKFKKKCGVRGCKNISDVFIISRRREMGNTIAMCRECMVDALKATDGYIEEVKAKKPITALFPHPEIKEDVTLSSVADEIEEPEPTEVIEEVTEDAPIDSVTEDTVTTDFFSIEEPITAPKTPTTHKKTSPPKKSNKTSKKKK